MSADPPAAEAARFALALPDLGRWRAGNTGIEGVWRFDSGEPGRHVLATALVHGNELCGAWALLAALQAGTRPIRGTLTLAFCNLEAFDTFDPARGDAARYVDEDLNRLWGSMPWRHDAGLSRERRRALALRPVVEAADWLLDLHSMHAPGPALGLTGLRARDLQFAQTIGAPALLVADGGHAAGIRLRDHGRFGAEAAHDDSRALLVECGFHGDPASRDVALDVLARFCNASGSFAAGAVPARWLRPRPPRQRLLRVTEAVTVAEGEPPRFAQPWTSGHSVAAAGTLLGWNGGQPMLTPYDHCVLVMPTLDHARPGGTLVRLAREIPTSNNLSPHGVQAP